MVCHPMSQTYQYMFVSDDLGRPAPALLLSSKMTSSGRTSVLPDSVRNGKARRNVNGTVGTDRSALKA